MNLYKAIILKNQKANKGPNSIQWNQKLTVAKQIKQAPFSK